MITILFLGDIHPGRRYGSPESVPYDLTSVYYTSVALAGNIS